jgi:predicted SAM-dependent methyltransferase
MAPIRQRLETYVSPGILKTLRHILKNMRRLQYCGSRYKCPVCSSRLRSFLPLPDKYRVTINVHGREFTAYDYETLNVDNFACPVCFATDRERLYVLYLNQYVRNDDRRKTLVHFAPEKELSRYIKENTHFHYRTADLFMQDVDDRIDITDMAGYPAESIDCFICSHVLEHIPDDNKALEELHRILKPDGWGIIMVPLMPNLDETYEDFSKTTTEERLFHFGQEDHVRVYAKNNLITKFEEVGFDVHQFGRNDFGMESFERCGITPNSILYIVAKTALAKTPLT